MNQQKADQIQEIFQEKFGKKPNMYFSPGRINLIGEHVDYNDGFVMPAAIDKGIYLAFAANERDQLQFYSADFKELYVTSIKAVQKNEGWKNYLLSVVNQFIQAGHTIQGFDCVFGGDIPQGSGMSSSAAVEGGIAMALNDFLQTGYSRKELALLNQRAEHDYPNVKCGIMDMFANMNGQKDAVILLDCQSLAFQYFPLILDGYSIVLLNSKVHHSLASSAYNKRRAECEEGLLLLGSNSPIRSFRDISQWESLLAYKESMGQEVFNRCLFVVQEIERTQLAAKKLQAHDLIGFGQLMYDTHEGLSQLYEVSCVELDFLVGEARKNKAVIGARQMGGGFGGCTINLVANDAVDQFISTALTAYKHQFNTTGEAYIVQTADGTKAI